MTQRRRILVLIALCHIVILLPGYVPVTEPLSDPAKAKPDNRLLGKWQDKTDNYCEIDIPAVKGNPKGLMRLVYKADRPPKSLWFFTTTIGKHTYATVFLDPSWIGPKRGWPPKFADFHKEGAFEKCNKGKNRAYFILQYMVDGDKLTMNYGHAKVMGRRNGDITSSFCENSVGENPG
jgi:hypothetical protein